MSTGCIGNESLPADLGEGVFANFKTTKGNIIVKLEYEKTPLTVTNFVGLAEGTKKSNKAAGTPFYDGLVFHRVIPDFMIQGGDPQGTGSGGPGYQFPDEIDSSLKHKGPGILSMANAGPGTNGSQFFITHTATSWLDGKHTVFGQVVKGQEVVNAIAQGDKIEKVKIHRIGKAAEQFKADQASFDALLKKQSEKELKKQADALALIQKEVDKYLADLETKHPGKIESSKTGLKWVTLKAGTGAQPTKGKKIKVHYTGSLLNGQVFDSSRSRGTPIDFAIGIGQVIPGWDEALLSMKKGEQRILVIPPDLAYGPGGYGPIPPNATLIFDVELIDF